MSDYHGVVQQIIDKLQQHNFWYETFEHKPVRTSEEAAKVRSGYSLDQGAKAIIVRVKKYGGEKHFQMIVVPGSQRFDTNKTRQILNARDIRFASEDEVNEITGGVQPGGVPPFGNLFNLPVLADQSLFSHEKIIFNAGDRRFSIGMKSTDYQQLVNPQIESII